MRVKRHVDGLMGHQRVKPAVILVALVLLVLGPSAFSQTNLIYHRFRFFIEPDLAVGLTSNELKMRLGGYVELLNLIFGKNTVRRFTFDPEADVSVTNSFPSSDYYPGGTLPETGYEIWAMVKWAGNSPYPFTHGGSMGFATNGAGVATGLYWDAVHDRAAVIHAAPGESDLWNFWRQLDTLAHEIGHIFGAGIGEYYSLLNVADTTGELPFQSLCYASLADPYWSQHPDYWTDPMRVWTPSLTWAELTNGIRFAPVTAAMINAGFRNVLPLSRYLPDLSATRIHVQKNGPVANALVKVWKVQAFLPFPATLVFQGHTDNDGVVQFAWSGAPNNADNVILIKVWPATGLPAAKWFSIYDAQEQKMVWGSNDLNIYVNWTPPTLAIRREFELISISWPTAFAEWFRLERSSDVSASQWQPVAQTPSINGSELQVTLPLDEPQQFFRLSIAGER